MDQNSPKHLPEIPRFAVPILNQLYEVERKLTIHGDSGKALRNVSRIKDILEELGVFYEDPMGQSFKETRTDMEANISGAGTENLEVVEVIKPIIRCGGRDYSRICQKGIVIVESKPSEGAKQHE